MVNKVLISAGPIPARLDSVKIVTNKFKGGLAVKTAETLAMADNLQVEMVKWTGTDVRFRLPESAARIAVVCVEDIYAYRDYVLKTPADAYVLAAAVANLVPAHPWQGKFPSHDYAVGEEFDVRFKIAPRIIDEVKGHHPRSTLVGYKLFDGPEEALLAAGWETLCNSRANVIFCNHPETAKEEKVALMADGTSLRLSFDEHVAFIERVVELEWYTTQISEAPCDPFRHEALDQVLARIGAHRAPYTFGTVARRDGAGFVTTTRGKRGASHYCKVFAVDHGTRTVRASAKATLNAPFIERLFDRDPDAEWVVHGHRQIPGVPTYPYAFSGTTEETRLAEGLQAGARAFNVDRHGYYALFESFDELWRWLDEQARG